MIKQLLSNKWLIGGLVVLAIGGLWLSLGDGDSSDGPLLDTSGTPASLSGNATVSGVDRELQATLERVRGIQLADPVLSDPVFHSLQDIGQQIVPEPFGRPNPFAPLSQ